MAVLSGPDWAFSEEEQKQIPALTRPLMLVCKVTEIEVPLSTTGALVCRRGM